MCNKGIRLVHVNTRSIFKKLNLFENLYQNVDVLRCSETWLDSRISDNMVKMHDKRIFRTDRTKHFTDYNVHIVGGGVCIFIAKIWSGFTDKIEEFS